MVRKKMAENEVQNGGGEGEKVRGALYTYEEVISEIAKQQPGSGSWAKNLFILLFSLFVFFRLGLFKSTATDLLVIIIVLLLHELGHFVGMRLFGYKNVQMFFIPFFGAAVAGQSRNVPTYKKAIVALLGPIPGIFLGLIFGLMYLTTKVPIHLKFTTMFLIINAFNLLPLFPLDGGRFLHEILFSRNRYLELCWQLLASLALIAGGLLLNSWLLALLGVFGLISTRLTFKVAQIANELKPLLLATSGDYTAPVANETTDPTGIPSLTVRKIIEKVSQDISPKLNVKTVATYTKDIWERMNLRPPGAFATFGLLSTYILCLLMLFVILIAAAVISVSKSNSFAEKKIVEYRQLDGETCHKEQIFILGKLSTETDIAPNLLVYHGRSVSYQEDGTIKQEGFWHYGKWDGEWKDYDKDGNLIHVTVFDKGKFVTRKERKGGLWEEKRLEDLPWTFRKVFLTHEKAPPEGPTPPK
jgi:Zn-dependent protease